MKQEAGAKKEVMTVKGYRYVVRGTPLVQENNKNKISQN